MLNNDDSISALRQPVENLDQLMHIGKMQSGRRLVKNINRLSGAASAEFCRQLDTLSFTAGQSR